jgi:hypothetical protein
LGKKSSKSSSKTTNEPAKWAKPHLLGAVNTITDTVGAQQGNLNEMAGDIRGFLPGLGAKAFGANAGLDAATGYATDVLGGKYLGSGNEYLDQMAALTRGNVGDSVNSMFSKAGRVGSDRHFSDLGRGMGEAELALRYQDYGNERNAMTQAAGMMPGLNASQYAGVAPYLAAAQTAGNLPFAGLNNLGMIGSLIGGYGTQTGTQTTPGGWGNQLLGAAASAAPFIFSDPALKTDVVKVGKFADGLEIVEFNYRQDTDLGLPANRFRGVMADQVATLRPWALGPKRGGYMTVDYSKLEAA